MNDRIPRGTLERLIDKYAPEGVDLIEAETAHDQLQTVTGARPHAIKRGDEGMGETPAWRRRADAMTEQIAGEFPDLKVTIAHTARTVYVVIEPKP